MWQYQACRATCSAILQLVHWIDKLCALCLCCAHLKKPRTCKRLQREEQKTGTICSSTSGGKHSAEKKLSRPLLNRENILTMKGRYRNQ